MRLVIVALLVTGCGIDPLPVEGDDEPPPFVVTDPTDEDEDGIPDELEDHLMTTFGPELRLPPDEHDWTRPANVDWYLPKVHMRFDHAGCPDDAILDLGAVTADTIHAQTHYTKSSGTGLCRHDDGPDDLRSSNQRHLEFFLQPQDTDLVHPGIPPSRSSEWRAYFQVRPSSYVRRLDGAAAAYDLQVWYFFPYNDNIATANHEADWEHMTISIAAELEVVSVFYATHDAGHRIDDAAALQWVEDTHVVGYIADGSHATYEKAGDHPGPVVADHAYEGGPVWHTWDNAVNLGDIGKILNGQTWARYGGRWGEVGETSFTSGPPGPMFQSKWDTATEYPKP